MREFLFILATILLLATACGATTSAVVTCTAPGFNSLGAGSCEASSDSLRDLKELRLEGKAAGSLTWNLLRISPAVPFQPVVFFLSGLPETLYDFRVFASDSTGNLSCADSLMGHNLIRVPAKATISGVSQP